MHFICRSRKDLLLFEYTFFLRTEGIFLNANSLLFPHIRCYFTFGGMIAFSEGINNALPFIVIFILT